MRVLSPLASLFFDMPFNFFLVPCFLAFCFILHMILHGFCLYIYFSLILHGVYILGIIGYILVGGLILLFTYHHLCMYFLLSPSNMYSFLFFSCYVVCTYSFFKYAPSFSFAHLCEFYPHLDEKLLGGVCTCILSYAAICGF